MPDDISGELLPRAAAAGRDTQTHWRLIDQLESTAIGTRAIDGAVTVRRGETAGCVLYGPYLHLPQGHYRLTFRCAPGPARFGAQPVLGVEIVVLSRFQQAWRDFTAAELVDGGGALDFEVPYEHSLESENEGRFEFRFFHLGNADLSLTAADLHRIAPEEFVAPGLRRWRLLGRLHKTWLGWRGGDGSVAIRGFDPPGPVLYGGWPYLRLPRGGYRLTIGARAKARGRAGDPALQVEIFGDSRWLSPRWPMRAMRRPETNGVALASRTIAASEFAAEPVPIDFAVPTDLAVESGADAPVDIRLRGCGGAAVTIDAVDLVKLDDEGVGEGFVELEAASAPRQRLPSLRQTGRRKIVMVGNCQSETLRQGFAHIEPLSRRFDVKYHFVQLPKNLHEFAARDLETCDILLVQDIRLWDEFALRDRVRPGAEVIKFPLVRFASLWPFDGWNGPGDREAHEREAPNLTFPYLDGLLGRLRREIADPEERFRAYRELEVPGVINYRRIHQLEEKRLAGIDRQYDTGIGAFILENFRARRVFHTTVRPNWEVFSRLLQLVAKLVGVTEPISLTQSADTALRNPQVPLHPKVARDLGVAWADETTRYLNSGREVTWEAYIRSYIEHYG